MGQLTEGLGTATSASKYLGIREGKLIEKATSETPGAKPRTKKDGNVVYEIHHPDLTGKLVRCTIREHEEYGKFLRITMKAKDEKFIIEFNFDSGYASGFLSTIPSANIEQLMMIRPLYEEKDGRKNATILILQDAGWCKKFFTKDNPNGLPELKKVNFKGKETWDNTDRLAFFEQMVAKLDAKLVELYGDSDKKEEDIPVAESNVEKSKVPF